MMVLPSCASVEVLGNVLPVTTSTAYGGGRPAQHPMLGRLLAATEGHYPPADGSVEIVPSWRPDLSAVVSFTGHAMIATPDPAELDGLDRTCVR